jgi:hypothetical protein
MQLFLMGYMVISLCEIFTVGEFPLSSKARIVSFSLVQRTLDSGDHRHLFLLANPSQAFSAIHMGFITATTWILMLNAIVGYQLMDDGTPQSLGLVIVSAAVLLIGTGYIALDTGFSWTHYWDSSYEAPFRNTALYVLYQLAPLIFLAIYYVLEAILVLRILGEYKPVIYLTVAALLFALGQIFTYVVSSHICNGTSGKIDGSLFETLFTLLSVVTVYMFWSSITEDNWPPPGSSSGYP